MAVEEVSRGVLGGAGVGVRTGVFFFLGLPPPVEGVLCFGADAEFPLLVGFGVEGLPERVDAVYGGVMEPKDWIESGGRVRHRGGLWTGGTYAAYPGSFFHGGQKTWHCDGERTTNHVATATSNNSVQTVVDGLERVIVRRHPVFEPPIVRERRVGRVPILLRVEEKIAALANTARPVSPPTRPPPPRPQNPYLTIFPLFPANVSLISLFSICASTPSRLFLWLWLLAVSGCDGCRSVSFHTLKRLSAGKSFVFWNLYE